MIKTEAREKDINDSEHRVRQTVASVLPNQGVSNKTGVSHTTPLLTGILTGS